MGRPEKEMKLSHDFKTLDPFGDHCCQKLLMPVYSHSFISLQNLDGQNQIPVGKDFYVCVCVCVCVCWLRSSIPVVVQRTTVQPS